MREAHLRLAGGALMGIREVFFMTEIEKICQLASDFAVELSVLNSEKKNEMLKVIAGALKTNCEEILSANEVDVELAKKNNMPIHFIDRLSLTKARIDGIIAGINEVVKLEDPVGKIMEKFTPPNGLKIIKKRVPIGVIGIIYEARPNVTCDVIALCIKSGNCVVLRGSSDAINTNIKIVDCVKSKLSESGFNPEYIQLIRDTTRDGANEMMRQNKYINVLIPRGGAKLIQSVVNNSTIPVIETGTGNCHIYVESSADFNMAINILINAKCSKPSVCNAAESLLVDSKIAAEFLPEALEILKLKGIEIRGCEKTCKIFNECKRAKEEDFYTEYNDLIISVKVVNDICEAIDHINKYGTKHSEAIITKDKSAAEKFFNNIDAAAVYHNASTRFTDGFEFGFGAEMGISNQKIHARGPIGLRELTTYKYIIEGKGNVR